MLRDVVSVEPLADHRLRVHFDDGLEGIVDVAEMVQFNGIFEPLRDPAFFSREGASRARYGLLAERCRS
jgi:hypothetical protein